MSDLRNADFSVLDIPDLSKIEPRRASTHSPRILLLYGSLRERSYSRFLTLEAERLLKHFGAETRVFDPSGLPLPDASASDHPKVQELRELSLWSEGQVWCSPERHGAMSAVMKAQIVGGCLGTLVAHGMFDLPLLQIAATARTGQAQWFAEFVATFGLLVTILTVVRFRIEAIPYAVGLYITAAYWFTASTSFANPAVTIARALTNTFAGIAPGNVPMFIVAQVLGALGAMALMQWLLSSERIPSKSGATVSE